MRRLFISIAVLVVLPASALSASAAAAPAMSEYPLTTQDRGPTGVALGPDGNVWFTENAGAGAIGQITSEGTITEYTTGLTTSSKPTGITAGPDGNLWFTEAAGPGRIGSITPTGTITEFTAGLTTGSQPTGITAGPDGNLWFTETGGAGAIGKITPAGTITEFTLPTANSKPTGIAAGPDGNLWFTETAAAGAIGRITPAGVVTEFTTGLTPKAQPSGITIGPDGNLWFTEAAATGAIGKITPGGTITEFTSGITAKSGPEGITSGNDGALYFTEAKNPGRIGRITTSGAVTETATATTNSEPQQIATGADGNLWFAEVGAHGQIGMLTVAPGTAAGGASTTERTAVLKALVNPDSQPTTYRFEYGTTSEYGNQSSSGSAGSGSTLSTVAAVANGLEPGTTYHFRVVAINASGTTYGSDQTATTGIPPGATTHEASDVTLVSATLNARVNPHGQATSYVFQWGPTTAYGHETLMAEAGSDAVSHHVAQAIEGLSPDTRYHFRVRATNCAGCAEGSTRGADETFTTAAPPIAATEAADGITTTAATLHGSVDGRGAESTYWFEWGETSSLGQQTSSAPVPVSSGAQPVSATLSGLQPGAVYYYRVVATNCEGCEAGTSYGTEMLLGTVAAPAATTSQVPAPGSPAPGSGPHAATVLPPAIGKSAVLKVLSGTVTIKASGGKTLALSGPANIPVGSTVDTRHGSLELSTAIDAHGNSQTATVWGGVFTVGQSTAGNGMTTMSLPRATGCTKAHAKGAALAARSRSRKPAETLWARDDHGRFSTRGHNSVATVRGTYWGASERCNGTLTIVRQGSVSVRPRHGRPVLVHAGHSYLARA